jgi:hypothetical protein
MVLWNSYRYNPSILKLPVFSPYDAFWRIYYESRDVYNPEDDRHGPGVKRRKNLTHPLDRLIIVYTFSQVIRNLRYYLAKYQQFIVFIIAYLLVKIPKNHKALNRYFFY